MPDSMPSRAQAKEPQFRHFIFAPGPQDRNHPGSYALSFLVFVLIALGLEGLADSALFALSIDNRGLGDALSLLAARDAHLGWRWLFLFFGVSYSIIALSLGVAVRLVHNRKPLTLLTDRRRFDLTRAFKGFIIYSLLLTAPLGVYLWLGGSAPRLHFDPSELAQLLILSCLLLTIQTSTEEALFRGYLTQFVASMTDSRAIIVMLPSLLFMFAHFDNPEVGHHPQVLGFYFAFGAFMSLIALRERGLELTIAAHFSNNLVNSVLFRTPDGIFQTPTIFVLPDTQHGAPLIASLSGLLAPAIYWVLTAVVLAER